MGSSIVQGPFSVAPCQTLIVRFATNNITVLWLAGCVVSHTGANVVGVGEGVDSRRAEAFLSAHFPVVDTPESVKRELEAAGALPHKRELRPATIRRLVRANVDETSLGVWFHIRGWPSVGEP